MGGSQAAFPSTLPSDPAPADPRAKLDRILRTYWRPVYVFIRLAWRKSNEDAKDLTQGFLAHMIEKGYLPRPRSGCGSFRGYLKTALKHFLINAREHAAVRRPRGASVFVDARAVFGPVAKGESPESAFDREWFESLLESATETLGVRLAEDGKGEYFSIFQRTCLSENGKTYREVAREFRISERDVRHRLEYVRGLLKRILRRCVGEYALTGEGIEQELRAALQD